MHDWEAREEHRMDNYAPGAVVPFRLFSFLGSRRGLGLSCGALVALVLVLFIPQVTSFGFVYDDTSQILENPSIQSWDGLGAAFSQHVWSFDEWKGDDGYYRPMFVAALTLAWQAFGADPAGWHLLGPLLHSLVVLLTICLGRVLGLARASSLLAGLVMAVHPITVQPVTWISGISDPLMTVLLLSSLLLFLRGVGTRSVSLLAASSLLLLMGFLTLERALPFLGAGCALVALYPTGEGIRRGSRDHFKSLIPPLSGWVFGPLLLWSVLRTWAGVGATAQASPPTLSSRLLSLPGLAFRYLGNLIAPLELSLAYPEQIVAATSWEAVGLPLIALTATAVATVALSWGAPRRLALLGAAIAVWLPVLDVGLLQDGNLVQDRYVYLALVFGALWLADLVTDLPGRLRGLAKLAPASMLLWCSVLLSLHPGNLAPWKDDVSLYTRATERVPGHPLYAMNLSNALRRSGKSDEGCGVIGSAVAGSQRGLGGGDRVLLHYNFANCLRQTGRSQEAVGQYQLALDESEGAFDPALHNQVVTLLGLGERETAHEQAWVLVQLAPHKASSWVLRGTTNMSLTRFEQAANCYRRALEIDPNSARIQAQLEAALSALDASRVPGSQGPVPAP